MDDHQFHTPPTNAPRTITKPTPTPSQAAYLRLERENAKLRAALERIAAVNQNRPAMHVANDCISEAVKALRE